MSADSGPRAGRDTLSFATVPGPWSLLSVEHPSSAAFEVFRPRPGASRAGDLAPNTRRRLSIEWEEEPWPSPAATTGPANARPQAPAPRLANVPHANPTRAAPVLPRP